MKYYSLLLLLAIGTLAARAQQGDEMLVYAVKGNVTFVENNNESPVRIGKVLKMSDEIKADKNAAVTLLCNKGRTFVVNKEGSYPLKKWRDSCRSTSQSLSSSYFRFIWSQLYSYSPENKLAREKNNDLAVVRGEGPVSETITAKKIKRLVINRGMDTVLHCSMLNNFPLSWNAENYTGKFYFKLYNAKGTRLLYQDTVRTSFIAISRFSHLLSSGKSYRWTVAMKNGGPSRKRLLVYHQNSGKADKYISSLSLPAGIEEDTAMAAFRVAYMLEKKHYPEPALLWYERANAAAPENELFRDVLIRFRNEYWIR